MVQIIIFVYLVNFFYLFKFLAYLNLNKIFKNRNRFKHKVEISGNKYQMEYIIDISRPNSEIKKI